MSRKYHKHTGRKAGYWKDLQGGGVRIFKPCPCCHQLALTIGKRVRCPVHDPLPP